MAQWKAVLRTGPWLGVADQVVARGVGLATTIWLVRSLGLALFGSYALANLVVLGILALFQALCVQPLATFTQLQTGDSRAAYLKTVQRLAGLLSVVAAGMGVLVGYGFLGSVGAGPWGRLLPALALCVFGRALLVHKRAEAYALCRSDHALALDSVQGVLQLAVLLAAHLLGRLDVPLALGAQGGACLAAVALRRVLSAPVPVPAAPWQPVVLQHWVHGRWLGLMGLAQWGAANAYVVAAAALLGPGAAGAIRAAQTVVGAVLVLANAVDDQLPVRLAALRAQSGSGALNRALLRWGGRTGLLALAASWLLFLLAEPITELVFGPGNQGTQTALLGLAWLPVGSLLFTVLQSAFRASESTGLLSAVYLCWTLVAMLVAEPVVDQMGLLGATLGMSLQQLGLALSLVCAWSVRGGSGREPQAGMLQGKTAVLEAPPT